MKRFLTITTLVVFASLVCLGLSAVEVSASHMVEITKTLKNGPGPYDSGDDVEFEITVENTSTANEIFYAIEVTDGPVQDCYRLFTALRV